ncbi:MAG: transposase [Deltaproteobacteria bacterium]|nr:transposase [Deltaproteobacteria bacterium]
MASPYPQALRKRVITAYENGEGSFRELAERYGVGVASVNRWIALRRRNGNVVPLPMGGARHQPKINEEGRAFLGDPRRGARQQHPELVKGYEETFGVSVSAETMRLNVRALGYTKKKRFGEPQHRGGLTWCWTARSSPKSNQR